MSQQSVNHHVAGVVTIVAEMPAWVADSDDEVITHAGPAGELDPVVDAIDASLSARCIL